MQTFCGSLSPSSAEAGGFFGAACRKMQSFRAQAAPYVHSGILSRASAAFDLPRPILPPQAFYSPAIAAIRHTVSPWLRPFVSDAGARSRPTGRRAIFDGMAADTASAAITDRPRPQMEPSPASDGQPEPATGEEAMSKNQVKKALREAEKLRKKAERKGLTAAAATPAEAASSSADAAPKACISLEPPTGTRDFYPAEMRVRSWLFAHFREVARQFAFQEYDAPVLEYDELYRRKAGEEITAQMYNFVDKVGARDERCSRAACTRCAPLLLLPAIAAACGALLEPSRGWR